jgi:hypothetical protein
MHPILAVIPQKLDRGWHALVEFFAAASRLGAGAPTEQRKAHLE